MKIADLIADERNANRGTSRGREDVRYSLEEYGAGRSILIDRNGKIIAGNKITAAAVAAGIEDVVVVKTTGDKLIAVQRTDLDLDDPVARELAIADNRTAELGLAWDEAVMADFAKKLDLEALFTPAELKRIAPGLGVSNASNAATRTAPTSLSHALETCTNLGTTVYYAGTRPRQPM